MSVLQRATRKAARFFGESRKSRRDCLRAVLVGVMLGRLGRVMRRVKAMTVRHMSVMRRCLVVARLMMLRRFGMVLCRVPVMLRGLFMMFRAFVICHVMVLLDFGV